MNVGKDRRWISLASGESWSQELEINERLPVDLAPGDKIRYQLEGRVIEMWNWAARKIIQRLCLCYPVVVMLVNELIGLLSWSLRRFVRVNYN